MRRMVEGEDGAKDVGLGRRRSASTGASAGGEGSSDASKRRESSLERFDDIACQVHASVRDSRSAVDQRLRDVREKHRRARDEVLQHCERLEDAVRQRRELFLRELDALEAHRVGLLEVQRDRLDRSSGELGFLAREAADSVGGGWEPSVLRRIQEATTSARPESDLVGQDAVFSTSSSSSRAMSLPGEAPDATGREQRAGSAHDSAGSQSCAGGEVDPALVQRLEGLRRRFGASTTKTGAAASSVGGSDRDAEERASAIKLEPAGRRRSFPTVLQNPCVGADLSLDLKEDRLLPLVERLGTISTEHGDWLRQPYINDSAALGTVEPYVGLDKRAIEQAMPQRHKEILTLFGGCMAGITSASLTHWLDVGKVLRQVGKQPVSSLRGYFVGLPVAAFAQGERFGVTLLLNQTLQAEIATSRYFGEAAYGDNSKTRVVVSFLGSMFAAGVGEALANPPVVVKNYQIATGCRSMWRAVGELHAMNGVNSFFSGVLAGVVRKSLANAVVLQTIGPTKLMLKPYVDRLTAVDPLRSSPQSNSDLGPGSSATKFGSTVTLGFIAGSLTGGFAEVVTNYPDRIKTLMQTKKIRLYDAALEAARDPFRGAAWAGLRKGVIRGINWGTVGVFATLLEDMYWQCQSFGTSLGRDPLQTTRESHF